MKNYDEKLETKYVNEALGDAKIKVLGFRNTLNDLLFDLDLFTVYDLFLIDTTEEKYRAALTKDELILIRFKRDNYATKMRDMVNVAIDPENCTIGPVNRYYEILLAIEEHLKKKHLPNSIDTSSLKKNSLSIDNLNLALSLFDGRDIEWLKLSKFNKMPFSKIGLRYGVSGSLCGSHVYKLIEKLSKFCDTFLISSSDTGQGGDKKLSDNDEIPIEFLELNRINNTINGALKWHGIKTVGDLIRFVENNGDLKEIRGIGDKKTIYIINIIKEYKKSKE